MTDINDHAIYRVCPDCLLYIVSGDLPADSDPCRDEWIMDGAEDLPAVAPLPDDGDYKATEFSTAPCECCQSPLAGKRYNIATVFPV